MLKEHEPPNEPLRTKAERKWRNNDLRRRIIEERKKPKAKYPRKEPEIAETIINDGRRDGPVKRFESRFKKEIRTMLEGHARRNLEFYYAALQHRRAILLREKLRRLQSAQEQQPRDLFGG
jgi:hypothetical protein